jgi:murein DD-endopeptidase MepM/ murein hydrolase activator NlpD
MYRRLTLLLLLMTLFVITSQPVQAQEEGIGPIYIVQPGDSLSSIANRFSVDINALMEANGILNANQLTVGQQLIIPGLEGINGVLDTTVINFGSSYRSLVRRTQVPQSLFKKLNHVISPSEFYVGASMIVPIQTKGEGLNTRISPAPGESMLEAAIRKNTDPWTLAHYNNLHGSWDVIPGDTLFAPGGEANPDVYDLPPAFISAGIRDLPIKQGGTGVIRVRTIPGVTLSGVLVDHQLHFFPAEDGNQIALQGAHGLIPPGVYPLRLDATLSDGTKQSYEQSVLIVSGGYPEESLTVPPETLDPTTNEAELLQLVNLTLPATPTKYWSGDFISPAIQYAESTYPSSRYGNRRTYLGQGTDIKTSGWHTGIDFVGGVGLPITAPAAGVVVFTGRMTVRGNATVIDHGWGVYTGYWHQSEIQVQVGQTVQQGDVIGLVGDTGRITGPHLHWEVWVNGIQVDPLDWLINTYP